MSGFVVGLDEESGEHLPSTDLPLVFKTGEDPIKCGFCDATPHTRESDAYECLAREHFERERRAASARETAIARARLLREYGK